MALGRPPGRSVSDGALQAGWLGRGAVDTGISDVACGRRGRLVCGTADWRGGQKSTAVGHETSCERSAADVGPRACHGYPHDYPALPFHCGPVVVPVRVLPGDAAVVAYQKLH